MSTAESVGYERSSDVTVRRRERDFYPWKLNPDTAAFALAELDAFGWMTMGEESDDAQRCEGRNVDTRWDYTLGFLDELRQSGIIPRWWWALWCAVDLHNQP